MAISVETLALAKKSSKSICYTENKVCVTTETLKVGTNHVLASDTGKTKLGLVLGEVYTVQGFYENYVRGTYKDVVCKANENGILYVGDEELSSTPAVVYDNGTGSLNSSWQRMMDVKSVKITGLFKQEIVHQIDSKYIPESQNSIDAMNIIKDRLVDEYELFRPFFDIGEGNTSTVTLFEKETDGEFTIPLNSGSYYDLSGNLEGVKTITLKNDWDAPQTVYVLGRTSLLVKSRGNYTKFSFEKEEYFNDSIRMWITPLTRK